MGMYSLVRTNHMDTGMRPVTCDMLVLQCRSTKNSLGDLQGHREMWEKTHTDQGSPKTLWKSACIGSKLKVCFLLQPECFWVILAVNVSDFL